MPMIAIHVEEGDKAFRVNGVTLAKRHLKATLGKNTDDMDKVLAKYLTIVPFLHKSYEVPHDASESIKYGAAKAHRLWKAIGLEDDAIVPFMLAMMTKSGDDPEKMVRDIGKTLRENGFYREGFPTGDEGSARKPTLH
jgi:hypothetical protein